VTTDIVFNTGISDGFRGLGLPAPVANVEGIDGPETALIVKFDGTRWLDSAGRDWTPRLRLSLPDKDVFEIDASSDTPAVVREVRGVGTVIFNMAVHPATGALYVANIDSRNLVRFESAVKGHIAESQVTIVGEDTVTPVHLNPHINYAQAGNPAEIAQSLAFPLGMEFSSDGSALYVAAFGSERVAVLDAAGNVLHRIAVGGGPTGLALDESRSRLYVLNRFDQTISIVDTTTRQTASLVPLGYDPEPEIVRTGRPLLYDARNSAHGDNACATCHIFGDLDSLAWDLGDPNGLVEPNPIPRVAVQPGGALGEFHPMKGPMTTQSLRGLMGAGAMHWRGDRNGGAAAPFSEMEAFLAFRPAFQGLLGKVTPLPLDQMEEFARFMLTVEYPPNPVANLDGSLTASQTSGKQIFDSNGNRSELGGDGNACQDCHSSPLGTDGHGSFEGETQDFKVAHLRNLYQKVGMFGTAVPRIAKDGPLTLEPRPTPNQGDQVRGFGFLHDGSVPTLLDFFRLPLGQFTFLDEPGRTGTEKVRQLESFLLAFPTGLAPIVGQQVTLDAASPGTPAQDRYALMRQRADAGECDLVAHGRLETGGAVRGILYEGGLAYSSDRDGETFTETEVLA
jgi:YVTN family beta-propeller protein